MTTCISAAVTAAVALVSAARLADTPARGRLAGPDPFGSLASLVAVATGVAAFLWLGRSIGASGTAREAMAAGAIAGGLTGFAGGSTQAVVLADYLSAVLASYAVPPEFLSIVLAGYVLLASVGVAVIGAAIAYAGWYRLRASAT